MLAGRGWSDGRCYLPIRQQQALLPSGSTFNLTTGRSGASVLPLKRFLVAFSRDCGALWRVFLGILPVFARKVPRR